MLDQIDIHFPITCDIRPDQTDIHPYGSDFKSTIEIIAFSRSVYSFCKYLAIEFKTYKYIQKDKIENQIEPETGVEIEIEHETEIVPEW